MSKHLQSLTLEHSSILDVGVYDTLLTIDPYTHFVSHLGCPNNYYTFVASTVGVNDIILAEAKLQLKYYGMLSQWHSPVYSSFNLYFYSVAEYPLFTLTLNGTNENAVLVCSATRGYPPITNIAFLKNGDVIASAASVFTLQVNTADLPPNISRYMGCISVLSTFQAFCYSKA